MIRWSVDMSKQPDGGEGKKGMVGISEGMLCMSPTFTCELAPPQLKLLL